MPCPLDRILNPTHVSPYESVPRSTPPETQEITASAASLIEYKRVPKACTQCRRDKSRCDMARPCYGCIRKGREELCLDGCVACRQSKMSCDESRPCISCRESGRECVEDDAAAIAASCRKNTLVTPSTPKRPIKPNPKPHPRVHIPSSESRSKVACLACRRDNKKCVGGDPCPRCLLHDETCEYVARTTKVIKQRCALCRQKNKKCEKARPCGHCVDAHVKCVDVPRKGVGHGLRVKRACAGCRADKIQCEAARPCAGCKRKGTKCVERTCKACVKKRSKCEPCRRRAHFHPDASESCGSDESGSEEEDSVGTPSHPSPPRDAMPLKPYPPHEPAPSRHLPAGLKPKLGHPRVHGSGFAAPHVLPSIDTSWRPDSVSGPVHPKPTSFPSTFDGPTRFTPPPTPSTSMFSPFPSAPDAHPMRPTLPSISFTYMPETPPFLNSSFRSIVSLSSSMSHVRTRQAYDDDND